MPQVLTAIYVSIFDTYAETQVAGALGSKMKYVIVRADETNNGDWTEYFFDGITLHKQSGGSNTIPANVARLDVNFQAFQGEATFAGVRIGSLFGTGPMFYVHRTAIHDQDFGLEKNALFMYNTKINSGFFEDYLETAKACYIKLNEEGLEFWHSLVAGALGSEWWDTKKLLFKITPDGYFAPRSVVTYSANQAAQQLDKQRLVMLNGLSGSVTYTINPANFEGATLEIRCKDDTNTVQISVSSGAIESKTGVNETTIQLLKRETVRLYSDGTNLIML